MNIFRLILKFWRKHTTPLLYNTQEGINYWREKILLSLIAVLVITAFIAYIPSVYFALKTDLYAVAVIDTIAYAIMIYLFLAKKSSVSFRGYNILVLSYFLGVFLLIEVGPFGAGYLWLFVVPVLAAVFFNTRNVVIVFSIIVLTLIVLGFLQEYNLIANNIDFGFTIASWLIISANFIFLEFVASFSILLIVRGLEKSYIKQLEISNMLADQKADLVKAKEMAENAFETKSEFLAQISHEIRTPINTILSFISLIKEELNEHNSESIEESFGMIENGSKRVIRTIDMVLNMSEIQKKSLEVNKKVFNLEKEVLWPLFSEFNQIAKNKGLLFMFNPRCDRENLIYADLYTVTQLMANLIDNAIKYTNEGAISISCECIDGFLCVKVKDTGIGMSEEFKEQIFLPFTQEETGYTRKYDGVGLGLSLVKSYCDINKVQIEINSTKDVGTEFIIKFKPIEN